MAKLVRSIFCLTLYFMPTLNSLAVESAQVSELPHGPPDGVNRHSAEAQIQPNRMNDTDSPFNHALSLNIDIPADPENDAMGQQESDSPWLSPIGISSNGQQLIRAIQDAQVHGLNPDAYDLLQILHSVKSLSRLDGTTQIDSSNSVLSASVSPAELPEMSLEKKSIREQLAKQLDDAFLLFVDHLAHGVVDAKSAQSSQFHSAKKIDRKSLLRSIHEGRKQVKHVLDDVTPRHAQYQQLTRHMRNLLTERAANIQRVEIADLDSSIDGITGFDQLTIKQRLVDSGDLSIADSLGSEWGMAATDALQRFQTRNGIPATGIVDSNTIGALNLGLDDEIKAVALSLERWRWMPRELGNRYLLVNIPDYRVEYRNNDNTLLSMKVVVGSTKHQTPTFTESMRYIEVNPTWTVPASIAKRDLIPKERKQPGYLVSRQFGFFQWKGQKLIPVAAEKVTASDFQKAVFPYVLQQRSGAGNALGAYKFMMPNPYAIYLHDTQSKSHFELQERAFSNGCIRLSQPEELARLLLQEDGLSAEQIDVALSVKTTKRVQLHKPVPTHLAYLTSWIDEKGMFNQRADIYNRDDDLTAALLAKNTLLNVLIKKPMQTTRTTVAEMDDMP